MKPSRVLAPPPVITAPPPLYPGQCVHRFYNLTTTSDGHPVKQQCLDCGATCTRDRAGTIELYDRGVIKVPAVGASGYYRDVADEFGGDGPRERAA